MILKDRVLSSRINKKIYISNHTNIKVAIPMPHLRTKIGRTLIPQRITQISTQTNQKNHQQIQIPQNIKTNPHDLNRLKHRC